MAMLTCAVCGKQAAPTRLHGTLPAGWHFEYTMPTDGAPPETWLAEFSLVYLCGWRCKAAWCTKLASAAGEPLLLPLVVPS